MKTPFPKCTFAAQNIVLIVATILISASPVQAQKLYGDYKVPKTGFNQPDLQGFWTNATLTPVSRPRDVTTAVYTEEEVAKIENRADIMEQEANRATDPDAPAEFRAETTFERSAASRAGGGDVGGYNRFWLDPGNSVMRVGGEPRTSLLTTPDGRYPARLDGSTPSRRFLRGNRPAGYIGYEMRGLNDRCIKSFGRNAEPPMFANGFYNNNYQIVQTPDNIVILVEMIHETRIIRMNSEHRTDGIRPWLGDSIGWWEGDTLVVETTNMPARLQYSGSWENLTVTERFTRVSEERLHYGFTIEDPTMWEKPWGGEYEFSALDQPIYEYACHEGNYALPGILNGLLRAADE